MDYAPIGAVCTTLGLLTPGDVVLVLQRLATGERRRFGDVAIEMGLLDEAGLARALAAQHRLNLLPDAALDSLAVSDAAFDRVPAPVIRRHGLVPVAWNDDCDVLSVVGSDPTATAGVEAVRACSGARAVRCFVGTRSGVTALLERLLGPPEEGGAAGEPAPPIRALPSALVHERVLVLEMDEQRARLLKRLDGVEEGTAAFASDPAQVIQALEDARIERVILREEVAEALDDWIDAWRRVRPDLVIQRVPAFGPSHASGVDARASSAFHVALLRFLLTAAEVRDVEVRVRAWRAVELARATALRLGLGPDRVEAVALATLLSEMEDFAFLRPVVQALPAPAGGDVRFPLARALVGAFPPPWDLARLLDALDARLAGGGPVGAHLDAEIVLTVRAVVRQGQAGQVDAAAILGDTAIHHAPRVVAGVASVLRWESLHTDAAPAGHSGEVVLVAVRDPDLLSALEVGLAQAGFHVLLAASGPDVPRIAAWHPPACIVADLDLPGLDGRGILAALRDEGGARRIPVLLLAAPDARTTAAQVLEDGAEDVLVRPVAMDLLLGKVKRAVARGRTAAEAGIRGSLADLPLPDLIQTLTLGGRTAVVRVRSGSRQGEIGIVKGGLVSARFEDDRGEAALQHVVALDKGTFVVTIGEIAPERNLSGSTEWLLLEALRLRDEAARGG